MKKTKNTPKPAARKPAPATLPAQLVESDSPNGPWTPIPDDAVEVRALDLDLARMENPILDEYVPIDHRTPWGSELLGFAYLGTLHEHFPPPCYMRQLREWLLKRGIDWRIVSESPTPWSDFIHLLRGDKPEEARPKVAGGATHAGFGTREEWSRPMPRTDLADRVLKDPKKWRKLQRILGDRIRRVGRENSKSWEMRLDGLPANIRKELERA